MKQHFYRAVVESMGTLMLVVPFCILAPIAAWVEHQANAQYATLLFAVPTVDLTYSYFESYHASQFSAVHKHWMAHTSR